MFGSAITAIGFCLLAGKLTDLSLSHQWTYVMIAAGGIGLMPTHASTDAVTRAPRTSYSEVTGITQAARNFGASLGLAVLGAILIRQNDHNTTGALTRAAFQAATRTGSPPRLAPARPGRDRRQDSRMRSSTLSSWRSRPRPRRSSTSWPASWPRRSWSRSGRSRGGRLAPIDESDSEPNLDVASIHDVTDAPAIP